MRGYFLANAFAKLLLILLPCRISDRIRQNHADYDVIQYPSGTVKSKQRMTLVEAVFATILFDLALFGTRNWFINGFIEVFTNFQNGWDKLFLNPQVAEREVMEFCSKLHIQSSPWIWEYPAQEYKCLNDFFSRRYHIDHKPKVGELDYVAPACCTMMCYKDNEGLRTLLIKGCDYKLSDIGLPDDDRRHWRDFANNHILIGYLSPTDYHRVHSPISGKCIHLSLEGERSASVKFFGGKFNILNNNKRLVAVFESDLNVRVALVVVGGIGVDTIVYNPSMLGKYVLKGDEVSTFRAGGSAIAVLSSKPLCFKEDFLQACKNSRAVEVKVGESLASFPSTK